MREAFPNGVFIKDMAAECSLIPHELRITGLIYVNTENFSGLFIQMLKANLIALIKIKQKVDREFMSETFEKKNAFSEYS